MVLSDDSMYAQVNQKTKATRVEWFRGRERYLRWQEEEMWLRRELSSVIFDFQARSDEWKGRSESDDARFNAGYKAYCLRQRDIWISMRQDIFSRGQHILQVESIPITV
jgi:hypothetical protein